MATNLERKTRLPHSDEHNECPECGDELQYDEEHGHHLCSSCGLIVSETTIDTGPERIVSDQEERKKKVRTGPPVQTNKHDKGLTTTISKGTDPNGAPITSKKKEKFRRLRKWHTRSRFSNSKERTVSNALNHLSLIADQLDLPYQVIEEASIFVKKAHDENVFQGRSIEGVASAAAYVAAKEVGVPRTLAEVAEVSRINKTEIGRTYRQLVNRLNLTSPLSEPRDLIPRFRSKLDLNREVEKDALQLIDSLGPEKTSGKKPSTVAAAAIYKAAKDSGIKRTQKEVAEIAHVTTVSLRERLKDIQEAKDAE